MKHLQIEIFLIFTGKCIMLMYLALGLCVSVYSLVLLLGTREVSQWNLAQHRVVHARVSWYWSHLHLVSSAPEHVLQ